MATIDVRDVKGQVVAQRELPAELFEAPVNTAVMHEVVRAGMAARRQLAIARPSGMATLRLRG